MKRLVLVLAMLGAACSPGDTSDSMATSTPNSVRSTSTTGFNTTAAASATTSSTTTLAVTTTATPQSTTSSVVEGRWADGPLITTDFGAIGWWDGSTWLDAAKEGELPVVGGEDYQTIVGDRLGITTGGPQTIVCETLGLLGVRLAEPDLLGGWPGPVGVAISAPWELQPHLYEEASDDGTYASFAAPLLSSRGLDVDDPVIKQVVRTDLEGDGVNEVLAVAEDVTAGLIMEPGAYSILFMRKVVDGEVETVVLEETIVLSEEDQWSGAHSVGTVADLNDDGKMEIVTGTAYFEGFDVGVWEYVDDDSGAVQQLLMGCGA